MSLFALLMSLTRDGGGGLRLMPLKAISSKKSDVSGEKASVV